MTLKARYKQSSHEQSFLLDPFLKKPLDDLTSERFLEQEVYFSFMSSETTL